MTTLNVCGGKYTLINEGGRLECLRNGDKWRDLTGDKLVLSLLEELEAAKMCSRCDGSGRMEDVECRHLGCRRNDGEQHVYHYHATKQTNSWSVTHIDGIARLESPVITMEDYVKLKSLIASDNDIGGPEGLTICSLTPLNAVVPDKKD